jgi:hypothetical protein
LSLTRGPPIRFCLCTRQLGRHFNIHDTSAFRILRGGVDFYTLIALLIAVVIAAFIIWIIVPKD